MANNILIAVLTIAWITLFVIVCIQRLTILEQRHEIHELRRWYSRQQKTFWDNH